MVVTALELSYASRALPNYYQKISGISRIVNYSLLNILYSAVFTLVQIRNEMIEVDVYKSCLTVFY